MNPKKLFFGLLSGCVVTTTSFAAVVPAGTPIVVRTNSAISSHATPGRHFTAVLDQNLAANGSVVLKAGTHVSGIIQTSRGSRSTTSSSPLTLVLTSIAVNGRMVAIKTASLEPQGAKTTRSSRGSFSFGENIFPAGTRLEFRLSQPVDL
jgi:hypothetical protein